MYMARALIISSDENTRYLYQVAISYQKIQVDVASDIRSGVARIKAKKPDVIILDIMVPDIKDVGGLKGITGKPGSMPVVIMADMKNASELKEASVLGAVKTLVKDESSLSDLIAAVRKAVKE
jgi:two-component system response regulator MtrA